jgi:hypoxanthine phosphoribosyltransferase
MKNRTLMTLMKQIYTELNFKMGRIKILDKKFKKFISSDEIEGAVGNIAYSINRDYKGKVPLFIVILNGAFMFAADLFKQVKVSCDISFVKYTSYKGMESTENVRKLIGLSEEIKGRDIVIIEDIVDSGITMDTLLIELNKYEPASIKIATLLFKPKAFTKCFKIDYIGIEIPTDFIVGYGLDYNGKGRNFPDIYKISL